jgi:hypothetical protein
MVNCQISNQKTKNCGYNARFASSPTVSLLSTLSPISAPHLTTFYNETDIGDDLSEIENMESALQVRNFALGGSFSVSVLSHGDAKWVRSHVQSPSFISIFGKEDKKTRYEHISGDRFTLRPPNRSH